MDRQLVFISHVWPYRKDDVERFLSDFLGKEPSVEIWYGPTRFPDLFNRQTGESKIAFGKIAEAIADCDVFMAFFSRDYARDETTSTMKEFQYALAKRKPIVLVQLEENYRPEGAFGKAVGLKHFFRLGNCNTDVDNEPLIIENSTPEEKSADFVKNANVIMAQVKKLLSEA